MESAKKRRASSARVDAEECLGKSQGGVEKKGRALVGRYVRKEFVGCGVFPGKIVSFGGGLYRVVYDDGDSEDLRFDELENVLLEEGDVDKEIGGRKRKLDQMVEMVMVGARKSSCKRRRRKGVASGEGLEGLDLGEGLVKDDVIGVTGSDIVLDGEVRVGESESVGFDGGLNTSNVVSEVVELEERDESRVDAVSEMEQREKGGKESLPAKMDVTSSITFEHCPVLEQRTSNDSSSALDHENEIHVEKISRPNRVPSRVERLRRRKTHRETQLSVDGSDHTTQTKNSSERDADSHSDSCESRESVEISASRLAAKIPVLPPEPLLPQSSGDIAVPEQCVASLFSVYNFLRSFSQQLFLSPFSIEDFVGSLNCTVPNTLLDAVHASLLRALKRHLEMLSSEGSERASKCLRQLDWSFLDTLTWPVYLVDYLLIVESGDDMRRKVGHASVLSGEYYSLSISTKLSILQILCDHVIESAELRTSLGMRENTEAEMDSDGKKDIALTINGLRSKEPITTEGIGSHDSISDAISLDNNITAPEIEAADDAQDGNGDECLLCSMDGTLVCCDGCPSVYHSRCIGLNKAFLPEGSWFCPECTVNKLGPTSSRIGKGLRGAEFFGVDPYNRIFFGTCNYLLVLEDSLNAEALSRYYNGNDVPKVIQMLCTSPRHSPLYSEICKGISQYWEIPEDLSFSNSATTVPGKNPPEEKEEAARSIPSCILPVEETHKISNLACHQIVEKNSSLDLVTQTDLPDKQQCDPCQISIKKLVEASETGTATNAGQFSLGNANLTAPQVQTQANTKTREQFETDSAMFKPQSYINQYIHGDLAASAAANLAVLATKDSGVSGANVSLNPKKFQHQNVSLQLKAFTGASMHFVWPCSEKKLTEIPRERCGWCISCKAPPTSRKGCLLNQAAQSAIKGAGRAPGGLRPIKDGEGPLPAIATYILFIEESLKGLIVGPFMNVNYRRQWRKQVEQSSSCRTLKLLLLELEENIRVIALSGGWFKLLDDCSVGVSAGQISTCSAGSAQKRGPVGRQNRKSATSGSKTDSPHGISNVNWWRRGKLSKLLFKKGFLPSSIVKKAAREGGSRRISGILYSEGSEIPRRSQQLAWRASVETCANSSQLALQVRYLDAHIRWDDLVPSEKTYQYMKGSDADASVFRNARICAKKEKGKSIYLLDFGNQKRPPPRVMKTVVEEQSQDGKELLWFAENHIPLFLIKEYEEKVPLSLSQKFAWCQRRQVKTRREDIFSYLVERRDKPEKCTCASCCKDVLVKDAVKCGTCQGLCHKDCRIASTSDREDKSNSVFICYLCYHAISNAINEKYEKLMKVPVTTQGQEVSLTTTSGYMQRQNGYHHHKQAFTGFTETHPKSHPSSNPNSVNRKKFDIEFGLIWLKEDKKKEEITEASIKEKEDRIKAAMNFRKHNILLRGNSQMDPSKAPICASCHNTYNPDLMYIRCQYCQLWFHADAVRFEESQIVDLEGFKCCKCRKKTRPRCPYMKPELLMKLQSRSTKRTKKGCGAHIIHESIPKVEVEEPTTPVIYSKPPGDGFEDEDDPLLFTLAKVERIGEHNLQKLKIKRSKRENDSAPADLTEVEPNVISESNTFCLSPKKLPVRRRNIKPENDIDGGFPVNPPGYEMAATNGADLNDLTEIKPMVTQKSEICQSPKKLQVRRRNINLENDIDGDFPMNPPGYEVAATDGADLENEEAFSPPQVEWDFPVTDSGLTEGPVENTGGVIEGMDFEPQTYFSFTELLDSDDDQFSLEPFDTIKDEPFWENDSLEDFGADLSACRNCGSLQVPPDLSCENCGLPMHRHCLQPSWDDRLICGFCQGQQ